MSVADKLRAMAIAKFVPSFTQAFFDREIDGDTIQVFAPVRDACDLATATAADLDGLALHVWRVRVLAVDAPELRSGHQRALAKRAKQFACDFCGPFGSVLRLDVRGYDCFGRLLAVVTRDGVSLADQLAVHGLVKRPRE